MEILSAVEILLLAAVVVILPFVLLALRRRWLSRSAATFECSARLDVPLPVDVPGNTAPSARWALGVARYNGEKLEWFRFFSYSWEPRLSWLRNDIAVIETRMPDPVESISLYATHRIVRIVAEGHLYEVAMDAGSITGFMAWLEAAPPGAARILG